MIRLLRYLKSFKGPVLAIVLLLVVQAYCDLSLPYYTASIVDIGISQGGIERITPQQLRTTTLEGVGLFLGEAEKAQLDSAYTDAGGGVYRLNTLPEAQVKQLDQMLAAPLAMLAEWGQQGEQRVRDAKAGLYKGTVTPQQLIGEKEAYITAQGPNGETLLQQKALGLVQREYEALGMDLKALQMNYLLTTGGKMLGLTLVMALASVFAGLLSARTAANIGMNLRGQVFRQVVGFSSEELNRFTTASLITRSTNDIQQVQMVLVMMLRIVIYAPIMGVGGVLRVLSTKTGMSWILAVAVGAVVLLVMVLMGLAMPRFKKMQLLIDRLNLVSREILTGIPVIRAFSREKHEEQRFDVVSSDLMRTQLFTNRVMSVMMPAMMLVMNVITVMIVWFGAQRVDVGAMQVGDVMAMITYTMQIVMAFLMFSMIAVMLPRAGVAAARIDEVIATNSSIRDRDVVLDDTIPAWKGEVRFNNVSFRYPDADADVIENIQFTARPGETTALIGSTGSGKSTILNLIPRFFDVTEGTITIDGVDIRAISQHKLRSLLGYVPQKGVLFSGDIRSNLKFGGEDITEEQMKRAARIAQAEAFIDEKPESYHRPISQGGTNVSGGQKQRLSIARAVAKDPKILLFDDSFSALDFKTDVQLRRALGENVKDATVIIVAQRINTILNANTIVVLDEGKIVGIGRHQQLLKECAIYKEIAKSQLSEKELGGEAE